MLKLQASIKYAEDDLPNAKVYTETLCILQSIVCVCVCSMRLYIVWLKFTHTSLQTLVEQCPSDDPDTEFNMGCILFKVCTVDQP